MRSPRLLAITLAAALAPGVFGASPAHASLVIALDMPAMVDSADHVAVVDVGTITSAWDDAHEHILTTIELTVVESWKGPMTPAAHLKVIQPGGSVGDMSMVVSGMTRFTTGERALVFLRGSPASASVVGMAQGKRVVRRDGGTGRWMVNVPDPAGASFVRVQPAQTRPTQTPLPQTSAQPQPSQTPPIFDKRLRSLDDLRTEVRGLVVKKTGR